MELLVTRLESYKETLEQCLKQDDGKHYAIVSSRKGEPTIQIRQGENELFLHSKYNPRQEAERIAKDYAHKIERANHIIFYGLGLAYHVEEIVTQYEDKTFTLIEPNPHIFNRFLQSRELNHLPFNRMSFLYIDNHIFSLEKFLQTIVPVIQQEVVVIILPAYERIFQEQTKQFYETYKNALLQTRSSVIAKKVFGKRWVLNSLMNMPTTLTTPNMLAQKKYFQGKPIIIAAAGPSLYDDMNHFKQIKEKQLAYIFAVGSANKALLKHGISPDAVLTYDPQPHNVNVFKELIASGRTDIPMIYGTSVGYETIEAYPGPKLHLVTSADTVSSFYLNKNRSDFDVSDATTIALIAMQVAVKLEAGMIILAGQNLAFKENRYYAKGVQYGAWAGEVRGQKEGKQIFTTADVYGQTIETNQSLLNMRRNIESYLEEIPHIKVINTTKGGAAIQGAPFIPIEELLQTELRQKVVDPDWYQIEEGQELNEMILGQVRKMDRAIDKLYGSLNQCMKQLAKINKKKKKHLLTEYNKAFEQLLANDFFQSFIQPIVEYDFEQLKKAVQINDSKQEGNMNDFVSANIAFLNVVHTIFSEMVAHVKISLHRQLEQRYDSFWKTYQHNDGVFHYNGAWEREWKEFEEISNNKTRTYSKQIATTSSEVGSTISFRFQGTKLRILAVTHPNHASQIKITIDGKTKTFTTKHLNIDEGMLPKLQQNVFEIANLTNTIHEVVIELTKEGKFAFQGIEINPEGRIYHTHEVTTIEQLEVGKRIRCHYKAMTNKVGIFSDLGESNSSFIPVESTPQPDGDFYFIMVDEVDGQKKLIADRNVQHSISWVELSKCDLANREGKKVIINREHYLIRLLTGGSHPTNYDNEWDQYIASSQHPIKLKSFEWNAGKGIGTWVLESYELDSSMVPRRTLVQGAEFVVSPFSFKGSHSMHNGFRPILLG